MGLTNNKSLHNPGLNLTLTFPTLTSSEIAQLENIDTTTISTTQWGYLGATDQGVATTDDVTFNSIAGEFVGELNATNYVTVSTLTGAAIQAAIDALPAGGGEIHLIEGIYILSTTINIPSTKSNVHIIGKGPVNTELRMNSATNLPVITFTGTGSSIQGNCSLIGMLIRGGGNTLSDAHGLVTEWSNHSLFRNLQFRGCRRAVDISYAFTTVCEDLKVFGAGTDANYIGFYLDETDEDGTDNGGFPNPNNAISAINCTAFQTISHGYQILNGNGSKFTNCEAGDCGNHASSVSGEGIGFKIGGGTRTQNNGQFLHFANCLADTCNETTWKITKGSNASAGRMHLANCWSGTSTLGYGFELDGVDNVVFTNLQIHSIGLSSISLTDCSFIGFNGATITRWNDLNTSNPCIDLDNSNNINISNIVAKTTNNVYDFVKEVNGADNNSISDCNVPGSAIVTLTSNGNTSVNNVMIGDVRFDGDRHSPLVIDHTSTEALLIRKNNDGGDLLVMDTTNSELTSYSKTVVRKDDTNCFVVRDASANDKMRVDTTNSNIIINDCNLDVSGTRSELPSLSGSYLSLTPSTLNDNTTPGSGTLTSLAFNSIGQPNLTATNASVTSTNVATFYIEGEPTAGTNQTITNPYAFWVDSGTSRFDGQTVFNASVGIESANLVIDSDNTEALIVRKDGDAGDIFIVDTTNSEVEIGGNLIISGTVDGRDIATDGSNLDELYTTIGLSALTAVEVNQIENIDSVTISNVQWGYVGALDQDLITTSDVTFDELTLSSLIKTNDQLTYTNKTDNSAVNYTISEMANGYINRSTTSGNHSDIALNAAGIVSGLVNVAIGSSFETIYHVSSLAGTLSFSTSQTGVTFVYENDSASGINSPVAGEVYKMKWIVTNATVSSEAVLCLITRFA